MGEDSAVSSGRRARLILPPHSLLPPLFPELQQPAQTLRSQQSNSLHTLHPYPTPSGCLGRRVITWPYPAYTDVGGLAGRGAIVVSAVMDQTPGTARARHPPGQPLALVQVRAVSFSCKPASAGRTAFRRAGACTWRAAGACRLCGWACISVGRVAPHIARPARSTPPQPPATPPVLPHPALRHTARCRAVTSRGR